MYDGIMRRKPDREHVWLGVCVCMFGYMCVCMFGYVYVRIRA